MLSDNSPRQIYRNALRLKLCGRRPVISAIAPSFYSLITSFPHSISSVKPFLEIVEESPVVNMRRRIESLGRLQLYILPTWSLRFLEGTPQANWQFVFWYQQYANTFRNTLQESCADEFNNYLYGTEANLAVDWKTGGNLGKRVLSTTQPVIECI
ncbi:hypothetical protein GGS21DRAFT_493041 [Xylaria nigripes]|nr:hypothetical protein GGS21DRAFT_493041 [Xylaria nigripes]